VILVIEFPQHEPSTILSLMFRSSLLQVFRVLKKYNKVWVRISCGLGSSVSEKYTACVVSRLSEDEGICLLRAVSIPDDVLSDWKDTVSVI
jgi:replication fork clamp-binding protein CrfC